MRFVFLVSCGKGQFHRVTVDGLAGEADLSAALRMLHWLFDDFFTRKAAWTLRSSVKREA